MNLVNNREILICLADAQNQCYYVENGLVKKAYPGSLPGVLPWLKEQPDGVRNLTLQLATNTRYFANLIQFTNALTFPHDGQFILADRLINGAFTEEEVYLVVLRHDPAQGMNYYRLEYRARVDLTKFVGDPRKGVTENTLQDDVFAQVQAAENTVVNLPCNSSNPAAVRVLYDGVPLQDKLNYTFVNAPIVNNTGNFWWAIPLTFVNNEGDSVGVTFGSQEYANFSSPDAYVANPGNANNFVSFDHATKVHLKGTHAFNWTTNTLPSGQYTLLLMTSAQHLPVPHGQVLFSNGTAGGGTPFNLVPGKTYTVPVDVTVNLAANERLFALVNIADSTARAMTITPLITSLAALFVTQQPPSLAFGLRAIDALQQLVSTLTQGRYTADSQFLRRQNHQVYLSGASLRNLPNATLPLTFRNLYQDLFATYNVGVKPRQGVLWVEPIGDLYNDRRRLAHFGRVSKVKLTVANEFVYGAVKTGYPKKSYNKRNGRYEYNCTHSYQLPISTSLNTMDLVSPIHAGCFIQEFIRTGYPNLTTTDDQGDNEAFSVIISDVIGRVDGELSTALSVTIVTLIAATPVIDTPADQATVYDPQPTLTGRAQPFAIVTITIDGVVDGTVAADARGNWTYQVTTVLDGVSSTFSGVHVLTASATTGAGASSPSPARTLVVNLGAQPALLFTAPVNNDVLYNNLPRLTGTAPAGTVVTLTLDGGPLTTVVANTSGLWAYQVTVPIADGTHVLAATAPSLPPAPPPTITVNKNVSTPLIINVANGDELFINLPTIRGVAMPGTVVSVYLDGGGGPIVGGVAGPMGTATADANGDWSFTPTLVYDSAGFSTAYIPDGLHVLSTTPEPASVTTSLTGFRLARGSNYSPICDFDSIRLDDAYVPPGQDPATLPPTLGQFLHPEALYNIIDKTPLRVLRAHDNLLAPFLRSQVGASIAFRGAEVNANLVTKKGTEVRHEGASVNTADLGAPLCWPYYLTFEANGDRAFHDIATDLQGDGYVTVDYLGLEIDLLPIGTLSSRPATREPQNFKLLVSARTQLSTLLKLFGSGSTIQLDQNMIYLSDKSPVHFVRYDFAVPAGYHYAGVYDNWQKNRFPRWRAYWPDYAQPWEIQNDVIRMPFLTNGVGSVRVDVISMATGYVVGAVSAVPVVSPLVLPPNVLYEVAIPLTSYKPGRYWGALWVDGKYVAISEPWDLQYDHPDTVVIDYGGSEDKPDFLFSTGIQPRLRVQGEWLLDEPGSEVDIFEDELGNYDLTRGLPLRTKTLQMGSERSLLADWMEHKLNVITLLSNVVIERTRYTRTTSSRWEREDLGKGVPEVLVKAAFAYADNVPGLTLATPGDQHIHTVVATVQATAFGNQPGVINITAPTQ